jgi:hypothetical protein
MKRLLFVLVAIALSCSAAFADVTVTMTVSVRAGAATTADGTMISSAKGTKFRADTSMAGQNITLLSDAATKQQWMVNHGTKQIEPLDPQQALAGLPVTFGEPKASVTPNGQTKEIMGRVCQGYAVDVTMPMTFSGETIGLKMTGTAWVAKDGVGVAEYKAAQKVFNDIGMSTSMLGQGPTGKAMADLNKFLGDTGVVMEQVIQLTMEGAGQMAQMMAQAGSMTMTTKVTAISTDAIPDAKFALPEGYTKK